MVHQPKKCYVFHNDYEENDLILQKNTYKMQDEGSITKMGYMYKLYKKRLRYTYVKWLKEKTTTNILTAYIAVRWGYFFFYFSWFLNLPIMELWYI